METAACISAWQLDRHHMGSLSPSESRRVEAHLELCAQCRQRLHSLQDDAEELRERPDFSLFLEQGVQQLAAQEARRRQAAAAAPRPESRPFWRFWGWSGMSALALGGLILLHLPNSSTLDPRWHHMPPTPRAPHAAPPAKRGKASRPVFRLLHQPKGHKRSHWSTAAQKMYAGDLIQLYYQMPKAMHLLVVGINRKAEVSVFYPLGHTRSRRIKEGNGLLPALELDDYIGKERIFLLTSAKAFALAPAKAALLRAFRQAGGDLAKDLRVEGPWGVQSFLLHKAKR